MTEHSPDVPPGFRGFTWPVVDAIGSFRTELDSINALDELLIEFARISAVIAIGAPHAPLETHVGRALAAGATRAQIWGVVLAVLPIVGVPRIVDTLPRIRELVGDMPPPAV